MKQIHPLLDESHLEGLIDTFDAETRRMAAGPGHDPDDVDSMIKGFLSNQIGVFRHAILRDDAFVGTISFDMRHPRTVVGFTVHRDHRGKGVLDQAWATLSTLYHGPFVAFTWPENVHCLGALERMGFRRLRTKTMKRRAVSIHVAFPKAAAPSFSTGPVRT